MEKLEAGIFAVGMIIHVDLVEILTILGNFLIEFNEMEVFNSFIKNNTELLTTLNDYFSVGAL